MHQRPFHPRRGALLAVVLILSLGLFMMSAGIAAIIIPDAFTQARHPASSATAGVTGTARPTLPPTATPLPATPGWTTVLNDKFTSAGIPDHWNLYDGPYGSGPHNCAAPSQDSAPGDGYLHLKMSYKTSGKCGAGWYTGGMMLSESYKSAQLAITIRWRIVPSAHPDAVYGHFIIPMIYPNNDLPTYDWYNAEDDLCEGGDLRDGCDTYLHYGTAGDTSPQVFQPYQIDLTKWHVWRFEQQDGSLTVYLDNLKTPITVMHVGTVVLPNAMRQVVLQQECPADACPPASDAGQTEDIQIDWIVIQVPS